MASGNGPESESGVVFDGGGSHLAAKRGEDKVGGRCVAESAGRGDDSASVSGTAMHQAPWNAGRKLSLEDEGIGFEGADSEQRGFRANEDQSLRREGAECGAHTRGGNEMRAEAQDADAGEAVGIEGFKLRVGDRIRMRGGGDDENPFSGWHQGWGLVDKGEAGEGVRETCRTGVEKTGKILCGAGESFKIVLGDCVADEDGFAGMESRGKVGRMEYETDVRPLREWE